MPFVWKTPSLYQILLLLCVGVFGTIYQFFLTASFKYLPVAVSTPLMYATVIFGGIIGWVVWGEKISLPTFIGMFITITGAVLVVYFTSRISKNDSKQQIKINN